LNIKLPEIRKIIKVGNSHLVSIPIKWLRYYEKQAGYQIINVLVEINGELKIKPYIEKSEKRE